MEEKKDTVIVGLEKIPLKSEREEKKKKRRRVFVTILLCFLFLIIGLVGGSMFSYALHPINKMSNSTTIGEIEGVLSKYWIYSKDYDNLQEELENKAFYGMTSFEEDPYTTYMSKDELAEFSTGINMDYVGIGVQYSLTNNTAIIERVFADSPAEKAGLLPGDIIAAVDGKSINGLTTEEIKNMVIGEKQTEVVITIIRDNKKINLTAIRDAVDSSVYCYANNDYVVMELSSFGEATGKECMAYLNQYKDYEKIIIDLRNNSGGYQTSVKEIAGLFIGNGEVYLRQKDVDGNEVADYTVCDKTYDNFKKTILLVNGNTASAAEVFAICLKEQLDNVTIVGDTTYGKGVIQTTHYLMDGGVLKFTSFNWYSPNGVSIHKTGIKPDVEVKQDDIAYEYYLDMKEDEAYEYDSVNDIVRICEMALDSLGYDVDRTDGYFDESFDEALRSYKADNNLENDGVLNIDAYNAIMSDVIAHLSMPENDTQFLRAIELLND